MMKKFVYSIAIAAAAAIASTGCAHRPVGVTPIPRGAGENIGDQSPYTIGSQQPVTSAEAGGPGQPLAEKQFDISNYNQDPSALAAYTIHFPFDSAVIPDSDKANLQQVAAALQSNASAHVMIAGNCDERGTEEYNRSLGERRAEAAREALVSMGVDASRIHTISYGKDQPADPGHDEAAWAKNRRDDFVLLTPKSGA